jgi:chromosome partitioning protein
VLPTTIAFVEKGGSGKSSKSSTSINLAAVARRAGFRVGMIDADPQQSTTAWRSARDARDIPVCRARPEQLGEPIRAAARDRVDVLLVDMPPDLSHVAAAARCADLVLVSVRPTFFDVWVTRGLVEFLTSAKARFAVALNAAAPIREREAPTVREALAGLAKRLWPRQITHRLAVAKALIAGAGVVEIEPKGPAAREYEALWTDLCNGLNPKRNNHHENS